MRQSQTPLRGRSGGVILVGVANLSAWLYEASDQDLSVDASGKRQKLDAGGLHRPVHFYAEVLVQCCLFEVDLMEPSNEPCSAAGLGRVPPLYRLNSLHRGCQLQAQRARRCNMNTWSGTDRRRNPHRSSCLSVGFRDVYCWVGDAV